MPHSQFVARPEHGVAWITGASSGIGYALALALAKNGWRVAATARSADALMALGEADLEHPGKIVFYHGDVTVTAVMLEHGR